MESYALKNQHESQLAIVSGEMETHGTEVASESYLKWR
jgi:hypothetical protein